MYFKSIKSQILLVVLLNYPIWLSIINDFVNRRSPQQEKINDSLQILTLVNAALIVIVAVFFRMRHRKDESRLREAENQSWNDQMALKYKNWSNI